MPVFLTRSSQRKDRSKNDNTSKEADARVTAKLDEEFANLAQRLGVNASPLMSFEPEGVVDGKQTTHAINALTKNDYK